MAHVPRLYVSTRLDPGPLVLDAEQSQRLAAVMRARAGDEVRLFAGDGREWVATVTDVSRRGVTVALGDVVRQEPRPPLTLELWCPLVRPARFEWAIEKAVELGADTIRPLVCEFSARGHGSGAKGERWEKIMVEATEQCGRLWLPVLAPVASFADLLRRPHNPLLLADPEGEPWGKASALIPAAGHLIVAVGPEGGFSPGEVAGARTAGAVFARLGPHILRTETAAVTAVALVRAAVPG